MTAGAGDRALQDAVIRALADAPYRASPAWRARKLADPERLERYARFLARHFYAERVIHFFKYSRALARLTGRHPEAVLRHEGFEALLPRMILGSRETAAAVARLVAAYVSTASAGPPYLEDLLRYEEAMMVVEAGPRVWREPAPPDARAGSAAPETAEGTLLLDFAYDLPVVLPALLAPWNEPPQAPVRPTTLLIARSRHGRVAVARSDAAVAAVLELADGKRTLAELARDTGLAAGQVEVTLRALVELGALRASTGS